MDVVAPETTSASFTLPDAWRAKSGTVQFFLMGGTAPYARRFAYLRTPSAGPWIDTGVVPDVDTDVSVTARYPRDVAPFGVSGQFYFFSNEGNDKAEASYWCGFFGANNGGRPVRAPRGNVPRTFRLNATGAMIDGIRYFCQFDPASLTQTTASTLTLFARKNDGQTTVGKQGDISIYAAQIRAAGRLTHDFVPCETAEGVRTLYNRVDGTFCAVSERLRSTPHSRSRLPNIRKPTSATLCGETMPAITVTTIGNRMRVVFVILPGAYSMRIMRSFFVVIRRMQKGCTIGTSAM